MKLLPYSNGVHKVNMRSKKSPKELIKQILIIFFILIVTGFVYQRIANFISKETLKERVDYIRVDDKRLDYLVDGDGGDYTVIFDGNIGGNLNQWDLIVEDLTTNYDDISTFVYNRRGYGFSDGGTNRTIKEQAEDLRKLLKKSAVPSPYILVGEEYGSLVLTEFAKAYPDLVAGVVLINPFVEDEINSEEFIKKMIFEKIRRGIERAGSYIGLTSLIEKLDLDCKVKEFESSLEDGDLKEFRSHRTKSNYTNAVYNEYCNITSGNNSSQEVGIFSGKPYYLIAKNNQIGLKSLGDEELTKVYEINTDSNFLAVTEKDAVINGIRQVIKKANEIERMKK